MNSEKRHVLYVDDEPQNLRSFQLLFMEKYQISTASSGVEALEKIGNVQQEANAVQLVVTDQRMPGMTGIELLEQIRERHPAIVSILVTGYSDLQVMENAINRAEVYRFLNKPWSQEELAQSIEKALDYYALKQENQQLLEKLKNTNRQLTSSNEELTIANDQLSASLKENERLSQLLEDENRYLRQELSVDHGFSEIITQSERMLTLLEEVKRVASTDSTVIIYGETGTGKELICRAIHFFSNRKEASLIKLNCAALPSHLIESELFGYDKGAFTGAVSQKPGRFELAHQGTLFLDEIGEMPIEVQPKLLRALQEGEFERVGGVKTLKTDIRVVAATNRPLAQEVQQGHFRADLYYRLNVFPLHLPALRERKEDIPLLVDYFVNKFSLKSGRKIRYIPQNFLDELTRYDWPGNVRELENVIERAVVLSQGGKLQPVSLLGATSGTTKAIGTGHFPTLEELEKRHIEEALQRTNKKISGSGGAAELLGINASTLRSRIKKLHISV